MNQKKKKFEIHLNSRHLNGFFKINFEIEKCYYENCLFFTTFACSDIDSCISVVNQKTYSKYNLNPFWRAVIIVIGYYDGCGRQGELIV